MKSLDKKKVSKIFYKKNHNETEQEIKVSKNDYVFISIGSMVSNTTLGSMTEIPVQNLEKKSVAWTLWENIALKNPEF
jgi:myosin-crossreactive antigen